LSRLGLGLRWPGIVVAVAVAVVAGVAGDGIAAGTVVVGDAAGVAEWDSGFVWFALERVCGLVLVCTGCGWW